MRGALVLVVVSGRLLLGQVFVQPVNRAPNPHTTIGAWGPGWIRGIRIGSAKDGRVAEFMPDATPSAMPITAAEGVAVDGAGNVYGAVVPARMIQKHVKT